MMGYGVDEDKEIARTTEANAFADFVYNKLGAEQYKDISEDWGGGASEKGAHMTADVLQLIGEFYLGRKALGAGMSTLNRYGSGTSLWYGLSGARAALGSNKITNGFYNISSAIVHEAAVIKARNEIVKPFGGDEMSLWWALGGAGAGSLFKGAENWLMGARGTVPKTYREIATVVGESKTASSIMRGTLQPALGATTLIAGQIGENIIEFDKSVGQAWKEATTWENWVDSYIMVAGMQMANGSIGPRRLVRAFENDFNNYWRGTISTEANGAAKELGLTKDLKAEEEIEVNGKKVKQKTLTSETVEEAYNKKLKEEGLDGKESELTDKQKKRKQTLEEKKYKLNRLVDFNNLSKFIKAKYGRKRYTDIVSVSSQLARGIEPNIDQLQTIADMPNLNEAVSIIMDPSGPFSGKNQGRNSKKILKYLQSYKAFSDFVKKSLGQAGETLDAKSSAEYTKMFRDFMLEKVSLEQAISEAEAEGKSDSDVAFYNNKEYKLKDLRDLLQESVAGKLTEIQGKLAEKRFKQFEKVSQKFLDVLDGKTNISLEVLPSELFKTRLKSARDGGEIEEIKDQSNIELKDLVEGEGIYFTKSGKIFVNQDYAKDILNFTVTGHEVLHPIMNAALGKMSAEKRINFINEFKQALPEEVRSIVQDRINKRQDITDKDFTVEWFNMTADALSELKGFNASKMQKAGDAISNMFKRNINPDVEFNFGKNGADAFMFIKRYADFVSGKSDVVLEKSLPSLVEEGFKVDVDANVGSQRSVTTPEGKIIENLRDFDKLNWKKYNTKQEFQRSPEFIAATDFLYQSRAFETQIKNKLFEGDPNDVKSDLAIHLSNFDPAQQKGKGGSLGAWMGSQFINKVSGVGKKAEKQKTVSADKPVGKAETPIAERVESKQDIESEVDATLEKPKKEVKVSVAKQVGLPETFAKGNNEGNSVNDYINKITDNINFSKIADLSIEGGRNQMISPFVRDLRSVVTSEASTLGADIAESMGIGKKYQQHLRDNFESIVKSQNPTYFSGLQARKGDMPKGMVQKSVGGEFNETTGEFEPKWTSDWIGKETDKGKVSTVGLSSNPEYVRINPNFNFKSKASQDQFINAFKPQMRKRGLATQMLAESVLKDFAERIAKDPKLTKRFEDLTNTDVPTTKVAEQVSSQIAKSNWQRAATARKFKEFSADAYLELFMPSFRNQLAKNILDISPENFTVKEVKKSIDNVYKDRVYNGELVPNDLRLGLAKDLHSTAGLLKAMKQNADNVGLKLEVDDVKWINKNLNKPFEENLKDLLNIPQSINLGGKKPNVGESNKLINQREQVELTKKFFNQYIKKSETALEKAEALAKLYKFRGQYSDASKIGMGRDQYFSSVSDFVEKVIKPIAEQNNIKVKINKSGGLQSIKVGDKVIDISKSMKQSVDALVKEEYFKPNGEIDVNNPKVKEIVDKNHKEADVAREILNEQFKFMSDKFHKGEIGPIDYALWTMSLKSSMETILRAAGKLKYIYKPLDGEGIITIKGSGKNRGAYQNGKKLDLEKVSEALIYEHKRPAEHMIQSLSRLYLNADNIELTKDGWDLNKKGKQELEKLYEDYTVSIIPKKGGFDDVITEIGYKDYDPANMDRYFNERSLGDPRMRSLIDLQTGEIIGKEWGESAQTQYNKELAIENTQNLPFQRSKTNKSNFEILQDIRNHDTALEKARNPIKKVKKLRAFDFDDTVGTSKNKVFANKGNEKITLNAEEFAKRGLGLIDEGWEMDFSDFNKVTEGNKGPLFDLMKKINESKGERDVFILTARAPEAAPAIHEFLKQSGINIPLKNVIGLGNSTGEAKAQWLVGKAAEGYNDFFFADDATQNVSAVKKALNVLDVKSSVQQANIQLSKTRSEKFNELLEQTTGVEAFKEYSAAKAKVVGANKGKFKFWIPYSAEDFTGLIYPTLGRGRLGDLQMAWYKTNLLNPYSRAMENLSRDRVQMMADFKELKKELDVPEDLRKVNKSGFTNEQAVRVYLYDKAGHETPGLSKTDLKELLDIVNSDGKLKAFADQIIGITKGDGYVKPGENWLVGTITTDLIDLLNTTKRSKYLDDWQRNVGEIYSKQNLNKLEAIYGTKYREALENSLARMKSGKNRLASGNRLSNQMLDFINGSNAAIMFFNTRSAALQSLSAANYINWSFNNPIKAGKAFADQAQYWKDFKMLMNSDYLVDRRNGLKLNIAESEIADAAATSKNKARAVLKYIQQKGYLPTQYMDSFAIASGGATYYRNRINDLVKKGMDVKQAEKLALKEWKDLAETSQQSSDPSKISSQQASYAGRLILMFANTPMQYARLQKRAFQDLANGRGDAKSNISKIAYYGFVQNLLFNALQQSLFKLGFGDDEMDDKDEKRIYRTANGMFDSILRGLGIGGQAVSVGKNFLLDIYERSDRKRPEYVDSMWKLLQFSPPISSKISRLRQAAYAFDSKKRRQEIFDKGFSLDNPALMASAKVISATANLPLDRVLQKYYNINAAMSDEAEWWQRLAMLGGWPAWDIMDKSSKKKTKKNTSTSFKPIKSKFKKKTFTPVRKKFQPIK